MLQNFRQTKIKNLNALPDLDNPTPENLWDNLKSSILKSSEVTLGYTKRLHRDWFDENNQEVQDLLAQKRAAHQAHLAQPSCTAKKASFRHACTILQRKLRVMQNNWWEDLARITQQCADIGDYRRFYEALKTVYGPTHQIQSPLRSSDGQQLLTEKPDILTRWAEHFNTLFSIDRSVQDAALHCIPHLPLIEELDDPPTLEETITAIGQLKSHKAAASMAFHQKF
ncbi:hypothetical protein ElyMa_002401100 [Elysia marginata]|uniref:Uncharacterized protein n=1 Tax=Elysia marginata TaxID=1093978 RepID=A0AAV4GGL4_9GAST|nr:hypothetical protein ElyMa_002401100 [Elysia marginata]